MTDAAMQDAMPAPGLERRDDIGRLVAVTWHGAGASVDTGSARWLVAVDGSACSLRAVAMVARLATLEQRTEVDLVYVQSWLNKEAAETELARCGWAATAQARRLLDAAALRWRLHAVMGEAAPEIVGLANALGSRSIAIGSHGLTATESVLLRTAHGLVVPCVRQASLRRPQAVLVPALGAKQPSQLVETLAGSDVRRASGILRDYAQQGAMIGAACTATFVLADAGLLAGHRATTSWWLAPVFRQLYKEVQLDESRMLVTSLPFITAGAALAHIDLALGLVRQKSPTLASIPRSAGRPLSTNEG